MQDSNTDKVQSLLDQGANPNHDIYWSENWMNLESGGWIVTVRQPPLHTASYKGNLKIVEVLVQRGASVNKGDGRIKRTPLHQACSKGHTQIVEYLIMEARCDAGEYVTLFAEC